LSRELPDPNTLHVGDQFTGTMFIIKVWRVQETTDERGSVGATKGWYSNKQAALDANHKAGWYGGPGRVSEHLAMRSDDHVYVLMGSFVNYAGAIRDETAVEPIDLNGYKTRAYRAERMVALAKLTERERLILKIKTEEHD
jgi:hypothetical protein